MSTDHHVQLLSRSEMPVSDCYHDLVTALATKLREIKHYDACERHAHLEDKRDIASLFARIASRDRRSIDELMQSLGAHQPEEHVHSIVADAEESAPVVHAEGKHEQADDAGGCCCS